MRFVTSSFYHSISCPICPLYDDADHDVTRVQVVPDAKHMKYSTMGTIAKRYSQWRLILILSVLILLILWEKDGNRIMVHSFPVIPNGRRSTTSVPWHKTTKSLIQWNSQRKFPLTLSTTRENVDPKEDASKSTSAASDSNSSSSILRTIDQLGQSFKPKARQANAKSLVSETKQRKLWYIVQSCFWYTLFIAYRAYRGVFVLLPAVFRQVYAKLRQVVEDPFESESARSTDAVSDPKSRRWRTRITVSVLATVVTVSYVVSGAANVLLKFLQTFWKSGDVTTSLEAAADTQVSNETIISEKFPKTMSPASGSINGTTAGARDVDVKVDEDPPKSN